MENSAELLLEEYEIETGFIGQLRMERNFDPEKAERYLDKLRSIRIEGDSVNLELVKVIWNLPVMLQWQLENFDPNSVAYSQVNSVLNKTINILGEVIGEP